MGSELSDMEGRFAEALSGSTAGAPVAAIPLTITFGAITPVSTGSTTSRPPLNRENIFERIKLKDPLGFNASVIRNLYGVDLSITTLVCMNDKLVELVTECAKSNSIPCRIVSCKIKCPGGINKGTSAIDLATFEWHWWNKIHQDFDAWFKTCLKNADEALLCFCCNCNKKT
jgi:hypothetical protein